MSLRAMKNAHEPVVVGLAGIIQERPGTGLAGMYPAEICINVQEICRTTPGNMQLFAKDMKSYVRNMQ